MNIKKIAIISLISVSSLLGLSSAANATCSFSGKVERIWQNANGAYIYLLPHTSLTSSYFYFFWVADPDLQRAAHASKDGNSLVNVSRSGGGGCPTNSGGRYGGVASTIVRY